MVDGTYIYGFYEATYSRGGPDRQHIMTYNTDPHDSKLAKVTKFTIVCGNKMLDINDNDLCFYINHLIYLGGRTWQ